MNLLGFGLTIIFFCLMISLVVWGIGGWNDLLSFWGFSSWAKPKLVDSELLKPYPRRDYDQELIDILKEAEKMREELPLITLWWGLQGLRLNKDGTTEWISRHPVDIPKDDPVTASPSFGYAIGPQVIPTYPLACTSYMAPYQPMGFWGLDCQNATLEDRISFLEAQEQSLRLAQTQSYQTRAILDNLKQWEVVNEEKGSYVKVTDILGNSYLEPCVWTHSQEKHTL